MKRSKKLFISGPVSCLPYKEAFIKHIFVGILVANGVVISKCLVCYVGLMLKICCRKEVRNENMVSEG